MKPIDALSGPHLRTYERIFQHPLTHNLEWADVRALFGFLGEVHAEANGNLKIERNGQSLVLRPSGGKDVAGAEEVIELRRFLERSNPAAAALEDEPAQWLLVIDHRQARLFPSDVHGTVPQIIRPHAPDEFFRHAQDSLYASRGKEKPDPNSYFDPVAKALSRPGPILIFGTGTGMSSEMEQFATWVKHHHPDIGARIVGTMKVDERHLTDDQLLAKARAFSGTPKPSNR